MKNVKCLLSVLIVISFCCVGNAVSDITIETKTSIGGIPFITDCEMTQTQFMRGDEVAIYTDFEIGLPSEADTSIKTKSMVVMNFSDKDILSCDWENSQCKNINLDSIFGSIKPEILAMLLDTLAVYAPILSQYFEITDFEVVLPGNKKEIMGYDCYDMNMRFSANVNIPIEQVPGELHVKMMSTSWLTDDIKDYSLLTSNWRKMKQAFLPDNVKETLTSALELIGVKTSIFNVLWSMKPSVNVESTVNITVEVWNEGMQSPSMSFNLVVNSILQDISYDKISDQIFKSPAGFATDTVNVSVLQELLKDQF